MNMMLMLVAMTADALPEIPDGALLFVENSCEIVERVTKSSISHVAMAIRDEEGVLHIYEAEPPRVAKYDLPQWFTKYARHNEGNHSPCLIRILKPELAYSESQRKVTREYLEAQIGRRYSIRGFVRDREGDGIHCAELTSEAIMVSGRRDFTKDAYLISPGDLYELSKVGYSQVGEAICPYIRKEYRRSRPRRWADSLLSSAKMCGWSCGETLLWCR